MTTPLTEAQIRRSLLNHFNSEPTEAQIQRSLQNLLGIEPAEAEFIMNRYPEIFTSPDNPTAEEALHRAQAEWEQAHKE